MPLSNPIELVIQRKNTVAYIQAAFSDIVLHRRTAYKNERGGADITPTVLAPQRMRILHGYVGRRANQNAPNDDSMGVVPYAKNVLIARWDADVKRGDWFVENGREYQVDYVFSNNREFELLANITDTAEETSG
jgi:hypothetical protein